MSTLTAIAKMCQVNQMLHDLRVGMYVNALKEICKLSEGNRYQRSVRRFWTIKLGFHVRQSMLAILYATLGNKLNNSSFPDSSIETIG